MVLYWRLTPSCVSGAVGIVTCPFSVDACLRLLVMHELFFRADAAQMPACAYSRCMDYSFVLTLHRYEVDGNNTLKRVFWIKDAAQHALFLRYLDVVLQDNTHNTNRYK